MILLVLLTVALFLISVRASQRLHWQAHMRAQLEEAISQGKISPRKAKEVISNSQAYGITRGELDFDSFSPSEERSWVERETAQKGWHRISTLIIIAAVVSIFLAGIVGLVFLLLRWNKLLHLTFTAILLGAVGPFVFLGLLVFVGAYMIYPLIQMFRYG